MENQITQVIFNEIFLKLFRDFIILIYIYAPILSSADENWKMS